MVDQLPKIEKPLVLVAADDEASRRAIWPVLENAGLRLIPATDGAAALDLFGKMQPDAILTDGLDICKTIRGQESGREVPILMVVEKDDAEAGEPVEHPGDMPFSSPVGHGSEQIINRSHTVNLLVTLSKLRSCFSGISAP